MDGLPGFHKAPDMRLRKRLAVYTQPAAWPLVAARWCVKLVDHKALLLHRVPDLSGLHTPVASLRLGRHTASCSAGLHKYQREGPEGPDNLPVYCKQMPAAVGCMRSMPVGAVVCMRLTPVEVRHMRSCCIPAVGSARQCHGPAAHPGRSTSQWDSRSTSLCGKAKGRLHLGIHQETLQ